MAGVERFNPQKYLGLSAGSRSMSNARRSVVRLGSALRWFVPIYIYRHKRQSLEGPAKWMTSAGRNDFATRLRCNHLGINGLVDKKNPGILGAECSEAT